MKREFSATFIHEDGWWIGFRDDVPGANAQERTLKRANRARESLKEAIADILTSGALPPSFVERLAVEIG